MKINQVEQIVGITKKNIRFYEEQGLLNPGRNRENGCREYSEADVKSLEKIKLFRKLGLPIDEIRMMQSGRSTVADSMRRHFVTLERERHNLEQSAKLCAILKEKEGFLEDLDVEQFLKDMHDMERKGVSFRDVMKADVKKVRYAGAFGASAAVILMMIALFVLMLWSFESEPSGTPPLSLMIVLLAMPVAVGAGVILALIQRVREIGKGEVDDAGKF